MTAPGTGRAQQSPAGIVALIMGIVGLIALPVIGSIIGLIFGYQSRSQAAREPHLQADDLGRVGRILSWIGLALYGFLLLFAFAAIGLFVAVGVT